MLENHSPLHAGTIERAIMLAIRPDLVDANRYDEAVKGASAEFGLTKFGAQLIVDTLDFSRSGATLDPRETNLEAGRRVFQTAESRLVSLVRRLDRAKESILESKPHKR
jgi:creatinine amidohydrolase/Fe(II)-dependent formamide hydrolase-like protein